MATTVGSPGSTPNLLPGVTTGTYSDPLRGVAPGTTAYYFNGNRYLDPNQANQAAQQFGASQVAQKSNSTAQSTPPYVGAALPAGSTPDTGGGALAGIQAAAGGGGGLTGVPNPGGSIYAGPGGGAGATTGYADPLAPGLVNSGAAPVSQNEADAERLLQARQKANDAAFKERLDALTGRLGGAAGPHVTGTPIGFDEQAARDAAFARAKDQAGQTALGTLKAIQQLSEETGQMGSSMEGARIGQAVGGAANGVNDFTRERYIQDLSRAASVSDRNYQGDITQRGQDIQAQQALYGLLSSVGTLY